MNCRKCGWEIIRITLSTQQKLSIQELLAANKSLEVIQLLKDVLQCDHIVAKGILLHVNKVYGKCNRCSYSNLEGENTVCPRCKAFNYNFKIEYPSPA